MDCDGARRTTITSVKLVPDGYDVDPQTELIVAATVHVLALLRGYPRLRRHERLKGHLGELVEPKIGDHRGRFVKNTGDGLLLGSAPALLSTHGTGATRSYVPSPQRRAGCHALRRGKGLDQSAANSRPQNLHSRAVAIIGSRQYGQGARSSAVAVPGFMHAQTSAATHPNKVQPRSRLRTKMAPRL
jgi:hypothetical protein